MGGFCLCLSIKFPFIQFCVQMPIKKKTIIIGMAFPFFNAIEASRCDVFDIHHHQQLGALFCALLVYYIV